MNITYNPEFTPSYTGKFLSWFPHRFHWISRQNENWTTHREYPVNDSKLWELHQQEDIIVGLRFAKQTSYVMIDIDKRSVYHPGFSSGNELEGIYASLESIGLVAHFLCQSSDSGGLHLYVPFPYPMPTFKVASTVRSRLEKDGFLVKAGQLEIFPNTKAYVKPGAGKISDYNGHRLPLQTGGYLLEDDLNKVSDRIEDWCDWMDWAAERQDMEAFVEAMENTKWKGTYQREDQQSRKAQEWQEDLESRIKMGWTYFGQTNEILQSLQVYGKVFQKLSGEKLIGWMVETAKSMPGFTEWCRHQQNIFNRCRDWVQCCESRDYYIPYRAYPERSTSHSESFETVKVNKNDIKASDAKNRVVEAINALSQKVFKTTRELFLWIQDKTEELFGVKVSNKTLYNHRDLWSGLVNRVKRVDEVVEIVEIVEECVTSESVDDVKVSSVTHHSLYEGLCGDGSTIKESIVLSKPQYKPDLSTTTTTINSNHTNLDQLSQSNQLNQSNPNQLIQTQLKRSQFLKTSSNQTLNQTSDNHDNSNSERIWNQDQTNQSAILLL
jgi:hypothetical protein